MNLLQQLVERVAEDTVERTASEFLGCRYVGSEALKCSCGGRVLTEGGRNTCLEIYKLLCLGGQFVGVIHDATKQTCLYTLSICVPQSSAKRKGALDWSGCSRCSHP